MGQARSPDRDQWRQASSSKPQDPRLGQEPQAASFKLDKAWALGYSGIMKTFIVEDKKYQFKDMEEANKKLDLPMGAWFGPEDGMPANTYQWHEGNFFD